MSRAEVIQNASAAKQGKISRLRQGFQPEPVSVLFWVQAIAGAQTRPLNHVNNINACTGVKVKGLVIAADDRYEWKSVFRVGGRGSLVKENVRFVERVYAAYSLRNKVSLRYIGIIVRRVWPSHGTTTTGGVVVA
jgi:hypothetical protein